MATVKMKKGNLYADIFDSPETIAQAKLEGYEVCVKKEEAKVVKEKAEENAEPEETVKTERPSTSGRKSSK